MKTTALIERGSDGQYFIFTPDLESTIVGEGETVSAAKASFELSVKEHLACYEGKDLPEELRGISFEYKFDIASLFNYFDWINVSQVAKKININPSLMRQYKSGNTYISENQAAKIEGGLHRLGQELMNTSLGYR